MEFSYLFAFVVILLVVDILSLQRGVDSRNLCPWDGRNR